MEVRAEGDAYAHIAKFLYRIDRPFTPLTSRPAKLPKLS